MWTEDRNGASTIKTANARNPAQTIYYDEFSNVGTVVALSVLDETLQPLQKGKPFIESM